MFPLLLFLISFLFCSRYSGHNSALYMLVTKDTMLGLWGMFLITDFSMLQYTKSGIGGGGGNVSYCLFIFMYQDYS